MSAVRLPVMIVCSSALRRPKIMAAPLFAVLAAVTLVTARRAIAPDPTPAVA